MRSVVVRQLRALMMGTVFALVGVGFAYAVPMAIQSTAGSQTAVADPLRIQVSPTNDPSDPLVVSQDDTGGPDETKSKKPKKPKKLTDPKQLENAQGAELEGQEPKDPDPENDQGGPSPPEGKPSDEDDEIEEPDDDDDEESAHEDDPSHGSANGQDHGGDDDDDDDAGGDQDKSEQ